MAQSIPPIQNVPDAEGKEGIQDDHLRNMSSTDRKSSWKSALSSGNMLRRSSSEKVPGTFQAALTQKTPD